MSLDTIAPALLSDKKFILATDLDGTFLGGTPEARQDLYRWITLNRDSVGLIFVTGRDPHFIEELCTTSIVPWPEYVVGDVGTTIAAVSQETGLRPITELEAPIAEVWQDAGQKVVAKLADWPGLTAQREPFRYRMSYDMDPATFDKGACDLVNEMGLDWLISADRFFDVLPKGVSKGPSLKRLLSHLGVPEHRVLVAGDTLNDLSMLNSGLPAVAVGGSEPDLLTQVKDLKSVHCATAIGAAGITEAIQSLEMHPKGALLNA